MAPRGRGWLILPRNWRDGEIITKGLGAVHGDTGAVYTSLCERE